MKHLSSILLLIACLALIPSQAQTPYDTFAPETSRPMLGLEAVSPVSRERPTAVESISDSAVFAIVIDQEQQSVYLLNLVEHTLLAAAPLTDDVLKWLSVDPLSDKYPNISPYAYCNWNPIKFVDPDGRKVAINGTYRNEDGTTSFATFYYGEVGGVKGFYHNGQRLNTEFAEYANMATEAIGKIYDGGQYGKMLVDAIVKDDRTIYLTQTKSDNVSKCTLEQLFWNMNDIEAGFELIPSFITLSHEFGHFLTYWYYIADYGTWYINRAGKKVTNDEKLVINFENLIRNENHLEPRRYYGIPSVKGEPGDGEVPQWDWVKSYLKVISNF